MINRELPRGDSSDRSGMSPSWCWSGLPRMYNARPAAYPCQQTQVAYFWGRLPLGLRDRGSRPAAQVHSRSRCRLPRQAVRPGVQESAYFGVHGEGRNVEPERVARAERVGAQIEPYAKGRFRKAEDEARTQGLGLWAGCFAKPSEHRRWRKKDSVLLGAKCLDGARDFLFPDDPSMPPGCALKGKYATRAHLTGHRGIYHLEGCGSYRRLKRADRWFCSEAEAQAEGFRRALNCRPPR